MSEDLEILTWVAVIGVVLFGMQYTAAGPDGTNSPTQANSEIGGMNYLYNMYSAGTEDEG